MASGYAQHNVLERLYEMAQRVDSVTGYQKAELLLDLAEGFENISVSKSMYYSQMAIQTFPTITTPGSFRPKSNVINDPDSILNMRARAYFSMGKCYLNMNETKFMENLVAVSESHKDNLKHAMECFSYMLLIRNHQKDTLNAAIACNGIGVALTSMGEYDSAMVYFNKTLGIYQRYNDKKGLANTYNSMAIIASMDPGRSDKAQSLFRTALRFAEEDSLLDIYILASCHLAENHLKRNNLFLAKKYLMDVVPTCEKTHNYVALNHVNNRLARIYGLEYDYETAYRYMCKYVALKDTLMNTETMRQINELAARYDNNIKQHMINELTEQKEQNEVQLQKDEQTLLTHKRWLAIMLAVLIFAIGSVVFAHMESRRKNKSNALLSKANENINNSLTYASRLQKIIITGERKAKDILSDYFVFHKPRNIVSGDFYYVRDFGEYMVVAVADCTGHGVPAAFLSVLNITFLNEIFNNHDTAPDPGNVLDQMRVMVIKALDQTGDLSASNDGMDCGLLIVDKNKRTTEFAGAYIDLYVMRHDTHKIEIVRSTHNPVCWYFKQTPFKTQKVDLHPDDVIYMFSDGYTDQVEPTQSEKYTKKRLKEVLEEIHDKSLAEQQNILARNMDNWQRDAEQIDDILILGIRADSLLRQA